MEGIQNITKPDGTIYNVYDIQDNAKTKKKSQAYPPSGPRSGGSFSEMRGKGFPDFNSNVSENGTAVNTDAGVETKHFGKDDYDALRHIRCRLPTMSKYR